jgi:ABC-type sugar transport system substrate-binding protein
MKKTTDQSLTKLADAAFEQAAQKVIERARQSGTPVIVWEDEAVKEVVPQQARANRDSQKPLFNGDT